MNTNNSPESEGESDWMDAVASGRPTPREIAARRRELAGRPAELCRLSEELALNTALDARPGAPRLGPIFASLVLKKIEAEDTATLRRRQTRTRPSWLAWLALRPAFGLAVGVAALALSWQAWTLHHRSQLAAGAAAVALTSTSGLTAESVDDFEAIRRLGTAASSNDEALIAALAENSVQ